LIRELLKAVRRVALLTATSSVSIDSVRPIPRVFGSMQSFYIMRSSIAETADLRSPPIPLIAKTDYRYYSLTEPRPYICKIFESETEPIPSPLLN
jgi:hypothetical protein